MVIVVQPNHVFGKDGAVTLAHRHGVPVLANIPLAIEIRESSEQGDLIAKDNGSNKLKPTKPLPVYLLVACIINRRSQASS